jgi:hypothetical protein
MSVRTLCPAHEASTGSVQPRDPFDTETTVSELYRGDSDDAEKVTADDPYCF